MLKEKNRTFLRSYALDTRAQLKESGLLELISKRIVSKIIVSNDFKKSKNIGLYFPIKNEVDLTQLLEISDKNFYFPICKNDKLAFVKYTNSSNLKIGLYNIKEPEGEEINPEILDLIYIPALIVNNSSYRLGYGKGYYDKFFKKNKLNAKKVVIIPQCLIIDDFSNNEFDEKCDYILNEM